ncbi:MAG: CvpA family protein [Clostridia bacterium]|nr:CvpA family protein [Clostridia bacterium]
MSIIIDLVLIAIIALAVIISAKQGFVRTIVGAVGFVAAVVIAFTVSKPLAEVTYDKLIEPPIVNSISETASGTVTDTVDGVWNNLPSLITENSERFGFTKESIQGSLTQSTQGDVKETLLSVSQTAIKPIFAELVSTVYAVILIIVLLIVVRFLAKLLNKAFSFSVVGKLNAALGGVIGLVKGLVIALIICEIIVLVVSLTKNGIWIFNNENISNTILFKFLTNII